MSSSFVRGCIIATISAVFSFLAVISVLPLFR
jgi:hypothetical protein